MKIDEEDSASLLKEGAPDSSELQRNQYIRNEHLKKVRNIQAPGPQSLIPTFRQINECIIMLQEKFPHRDVGAMISLISNNLIKKETPPVVDRVTNTKTNEVRRPNHLSKQNQIQRMEQNIKELIVPKRHSTRKTYSGTSSRIRKTFATELDQRKYMQKLICARAFVNRGYGIHQVLAEQNEYNLTPGIKFKVDVQKNRYKTISSSIATDVYRRLEHFLIKECKRKINFLNREEMRAIFSILLNCKKNFPAEDCNTLYKFFKIEYGISSVTITEEEAIQLYISLQNALKLRIGQMQLDRSYNKEVTVNDSLKGRRARCTERFQIHKIWNTSMENQMLQFYKRHDAFAKIRDAFRNKYPQYAQMFSIQSIRSQFFKVMRVALRKVGRFCQEFGASRVPSLIKLNDLKIKFLLRCPAALKARLLMIQIYQNNTVQITKLYQAVSSINDFIIMKDNDRLNQVIEFAPDMRSASEKIAHNVNITKLKSKDAYQNQVKQDVYLKGQDKEYQHIVSTDKGKSLHYYRKIQPKNEASQPQDQKIANIDDLDLGEDIVFNDKDDLEDIYFDDEDNKDKDQDKNQDKHYDEEESASSNQHTKFGRSPYNPNSNQNNTPKPKRIRDEVYQNSVQFVQEMKGFIDESNQIQLEVAEDNAIDRKLKESMKKIVQNSQ